MEDRVADKINEIEIFLEELNSSLPLNFEEYEKDFKIRAICERYFEKIVEAVVDLAYLFIKFKRFNIPEREKELFELLARKEIISERLALKLKDAKGMRNILAHEYGEIDDEQVFESVTEELIKDVVEFIEALQKNKQENKND